jgi:hypothetical protein
MPSLAEHLDWTYLKYIQYTIQRSLLTLKVKQNFDLCNAEHPLIVYHL